MTKGDMIRVNSRDGFTFDAYHVKAQGPRKGGVIVVQEIFGLSDHIKEMAERLGAAGYEAIAPSMYDRAAPGFIVQPADVAANMARGVELAMGNGPENAMNDIGGVFDDEMLKSHLIVWIVCIEFLKRGLDHQWRCQRQLPTNYHSTLILQYSILIFFKGTPGPNKYGEPPVD